MAKNDISAIGVRLRRTRKHEKFSDEKRATIPARVIKFHDDCERAREAEAGMREERNAKYRLLTASQATYPSDIALPDMLADSLRAQDGLMNAVLATRPMILASALQTNAKDRQENVDRLLDYQFFVENNGEELLAEMAESFVNDGHYTVFLPWIEEKKAIRQSRTFDPVPGDTFPAAYFSVLIQQNFPGATAASPLSDDGWDFIVTSGAEQYRVGFYTDAD